MDGRIRIKLGKMEIEYEGPADFLKNDLVALIKDLGSVSEEIQRQDNCPDGDVSVGEAFEGSGSQDDPAPLDYSINTVASKLGVQSGRDMVLASAAYLSFVENRESFTRQDLLRTMQRATSYYKQTMGSNLSKTISRMIKGDDLLEGSKGTYSIAALRKGQLRHELGL